MKNNLGLVIVFYAALLTLVGQNVMAAAPPVNTVSSKPANVGRYPTIFPTPLKVVWGDGAFVVSADESVDTDDPTDAADILTSLNAKDGGDHILRSSGRIHFRQLAKRDDWLGDEGYRIQVTPDEVLAEANTPAGLYYSSLSLIQLVESRGKNSYIPVVTIEDRPAMAYRGVMIDISRGLVPTAPTFDRIIRALAELKINAVQPYIEDTYAFEAYPFIGRDRGAWTPAEAAEIARTAERYHVDISPCFESLGHMGQILRHPEMADYRESGDVINPTNDSTYSFLDHCFVELAAAFPSTYFNVGCDETQSLGTGPSKATVDKIGIGEVYSMHLDRLDEMCHFIDRKMQYWGDMALKYPGVMAELPKDAIVMNWDYGTQSGFRSIDAFKAGGYQQIVCPGIGSWGQMFTNSRGSEGNIRGFIKEGKAAGALGVLNTAWRDNGEVFYDYDWYAEGIGAECSWADVPAEGGAFDTAFQNEFFGSSSNGPVEAFDCLSQSLSLPGYGYGGALDLYYSDPFKNLSDMLSPRLQGSLNKLTVLAHTVRQSCASPGRHSEVLPYLLFGADRISYISDKYHTAWDIAYLYDSALTEAGDGTSRSKGDAEKKLSAALQDAAILSNETRSLKDRYSQLWLAENKPQGLQNVLDRYAPELASFDTLRGKLQTAVISLKAGSPLPSAADLGLSLPTITPDGYRIPARLASVPSWAPAGSVAFQVNLPAVLPQVVPLRLKMDSGLLPPNISRLASLLQVDDSGNTIQKYDCQIDRLDAKYSIVTTLLPAGSHGELNLILSAAPGDVADPVRVSAASELPGGLWISNSRFKALLGPQGGHLFRFDVAALAGLDVTVPGDDDWHGFDDVGGERNATFALKQTCSGPLCVQIDCTAPDGFSKTLTFYAGLGWYDTRLSDPVNFFWSYDDPSVMNAAAQTPAAYRYSDGTTGPLPALSAYSIADTASWVAKFRADGYVLGLISPEAKPTLRAGPGGSMGGVGVEGSGATNHLLTYSDVTAGNWNTVSDLYDSVSRLSQAKVCYR